MDAHEGRTSLAEAPFVPAAPTVPEAVAWWSRQTPDAPALLDFDGRVVTFGHLQRSIDAFRGRLAALGVGRGDRVILALPDGVTAAMAGLATIASAVAVPVNPGHAPAEAEPTVAAVNPALVVVAAGASTVYREIAAAARTPVLELDPEAMLSDGSIEATAGQATAIAYPDAADLAMILLTSGTTDLPQRAPATHASLLATCRARAQAWRLGPDDRGLSTSPAYFVLGLARVADALVTGGSSIVAAAWRVAQRPERVRSLGATWAWLTPSLLETLLAHPEAEGVRDWPLRFIRSGSAQVTPDLIARCEVGLGVPLLVGYGMTEALGYVTAEGVAEVSPRRLGSVGRAWPEMEIAIRDEAGQPLADGEIGEITVRGPSVFPGYLDDPAATAAAFHPGGWYRTGDLGYLDDEGYLFVTGRTREMINRGGEKIAPHEIDEVLRAHPAVADAAAFALPHPRLGEEIVAAVVPRDGAAVTARALRLWLARRLSPHKVPRQIWLLDDLPRTGSGKIQRAALTARFKA